MTPTMTAARYTFTLPVGKDFRKRMRERAVLLRPETSFGLWLLRDFESELFKAGARRVSYSEAGTIRYTLEGTVNGPDRLPAVQDRVISIVTDACRGEFIGRLRKDLGEMREMPQ